MSGLEIVGVVLGSFPILLNVLDYYRQSSQPLQDFVHFRTRLLAFTDKVRHQRMLYRQNMTELLRPTITRAEGRNSLVDDFNDPRWSDGSLEKLLSDRLEGEEDRFIRIVKDMADTLNELKRLLGIQEGRTSWTDGPSRDHFRRLRFCLSKSKYRNISKLADGNQQLQEMLGYGGWLAANIDSHCSSHSILRFEQVRSQALRVHEALEFHWKCRLGARCISHQVSLKLDAAVATNTLYLLFTLNTEPPSYPNTREILVQPASTASNQLVGPSSAPSPRTHLGRTPITTSVTSSNTTTKLSSIPSTSTIQVSDTDTNSEIKDLCTALQAYTNTSTDLGFIANCSDEKFRLSVAEPKLVPSNAVLTPLTQLLDAKKADMLEMSREQRFKMAANIACAFLQVQGSPWLSRTWTKDELYFIADISTAKTIFSESIYLSRTYSSSSSSSAKRDWVDTQLPQSSASTALVALAREIVRTALFRLGIVILELVFGQTIELCQYYVRKLKEAGPSFEPQEIEKLAATEWEEKVLGNAGATVQDAIKRCLHCSFQRTLTPDLREEGFREAIFQGVVVPLKSYNQNLWP